MAKVNLFYPNLRAEMARTDKRGKEVAEAAHMSPSTFSQKLKGKRGFTLDEAVRVKSYLGVDLPLEILFVKVL